MSDLSIGFVNSMVEFSTGYLIPIMFFGFFLALALRGLLYFTVRCENRFTEEFDKRSVRYLREVSEGKQKQESSFYVLVKALLMQTFQESFENKRKFKRRRPDHITTHTDRLFLIEDGARRLVLDTLKQSRYLRKGDPNPPRFIEVTKSVFHSNPAFTRVLGIFPVNLLNDLLGVLPGMFIIGGIFGTFLGIMKALPELGAMNISDVESTKQVMDVFLLKISFSMSTSVVGIVLSVAMTVLNTILSAETLYLGLISRYSTTLETLWNETKTNEVPEGENYSQETPHEDRRETRDLFEPSPEPKNDSAA